MDSDQRLATLNPASRIPDASAPRNQSTCQSANANGCPRSSPAGTRRVVRAQAATAAAGSDAAVGTGVAGGCRAARFRARYARIYAARSRVGTSATPPRRPATPDGGGAPGYACVHSEAPGVRAAACEYFDPPLLLACFLVVTGGAQVLEVGAVHEAAAVGEWGDVVDLFARHSQALCRA